jgi:protein-arginine kinase activator protein McsA
MICSKCGKNNAVYHSVITINGVATEEHLCADCYSGKSDRFSRFVEECFLSPFDAFDMLLPMGYLSDKYDVYSVNNYNKFDNNYNYYAKYQNILDEAKKSISKGMNKVYNE